MSSNNSRRVEILAIGQVKWAAQAVCGETIQLDTSGQLSYAYFGSKNSL
jgi:hypothetical protein